jgi:hypothetical protein
VYIHWGNNIEENNNNKQTHKKQQHKNSTSLQEIPMFSKICERNYPIMPGLLVLCLRKNKLA